MVIDVHLKQPCRDFADLGSSNHFPIDDFKMFVPALLAGVEQRHDFNSVRRQ